MRRVVVLTSVLSATAALAVTAPGAAAEAPQVSSSRVATAASPDPQGPPPWVTGTVAPDTLPDAPDAVTAPVPVPTGVLVRFGDGLAPDADTAVLGALAVGADPVPGTDYVAVPTKGEDPAAVVARLEADPRVAEVEVDGVVSAAGWTDDPLLAVTWPYLDLMRLPRAWDVGNGAGTVIAVVDSGVSAFHQELAGSVLPGWDFVDGDADASDAQWHGTAVAGVAMAHGDNGMGSVGAAWGASVLPVRVLDRDGYGTYSDVAAGIVYAADRGADVINVSVTGSAPSAVLRDAVEYAVAQGSVVVAASGDDGSDSPQYPAAYASEIPGMLSVGATDQDGALAGFSSWGDSVSLAAPGAGVVVLDQWSPNYDAKASGTSFAAAFVSGAAALLAEQGLDPAAITSALRSSARDAGPRGVDPYYGAGVLDAAAALGLGSSTPLDRPAGDRAVDDTPARAQPLALGVVHSDTLAPQGDEDWYSVSVPARGWYRVVVTPAASWQDPVPTRSLVALDSRGAVLPQTNATLGETVIPVSAPGRIRLGISDVSGDDAEPGYTVEVRLAASTAQFRQARTPLSTTIGDAAIVVGDLTGDGVADVLVARDAPVVLPGVGDGTVGGEVTVPTPAGSTFGYNPVAAVLDVDRDGDTDAVVKTRSGLVVARQDPAGLVAGSAVTTGGDVLQLVTADVDGDGIDELGAYDISGALTVYRTSASGLVPVRTVTSTGRPLLVDVDGDRLADIVTISGVQLQLPDGSFGPATTLAGDAPPSFVEGLAVGDLTGDGRMDVVRSVGGAGDHLVVNTGTGGGGFGAGVSYPTEYMAGPVVVGDLDSDGRSDVVMAGSGSLTVFRQLPQGILSAAERWTECCYDRVGPRGLATADLDRDGRLDVVLAHDGGVSTMTQVALDSTGPAAWLQDLTPLPHTGGVEVRPTARLTVGPDVAPVSVTAGTVRLVDGLTRDDLPAARSYDAVSHVLSLTPTSDLVPGHHYEVVVSGLTDVGGAVQGVPIRTWFTVAAGGDRFTPVQPWRVLDTRDPDGVDYGPVEPGAPAHISLGGVEVPADATAVVLNVTAVSPTGVGNVRVYPTPDGADVPPTVSNLNVVPGVDQPNLVTVRLGVDGLISLATDGMTTDLVADLAGYYSPGGATGFVPLDPVRAMDTRSGAGDVPAQRVAAGQWVDLQVAGRLGVPADASAVVLNVTATSVGGGTNVRVYPSPADSEWQEPPLVSNLNVGPGRDQPNLVTVQVGDGGRVRFYTQTAALDLVADVAGYYSPTGSQGFVPLTPTRIADTRSGLGLPGGVLRAGQTRTLGVAGVGAVPSAATAAVLNVTAVAPRGTSNVRVFPATATSQVPLVSNLNVVLGRDEPNLALVRLGTGGAVSFFSQTADLGLVADVSGYFRP